MNVKRRDLNRSIPLHDYSPALQSAVSWLGDRYLLAAPVVRRPDDRAPFFKEPTRWHPALLGASPRR